MNFLEPTALFYIAGAVFLLLIIYYRKRISLVFTNFRYGKYSYRYLSKFYSYFYEIQFPPSILYDPVTYILPFFRNEIRGVEKKTDEEIEFGGFQPGHSYPDFFKKNGKPRYISITEPDAKEIKLVVAGYPRKINNHHCVMLYFFHENTFIMGQYQFKREKQKVDTALLSESVQKKYLNGGTQTGLEDFIIKDDRGSRVHFHDNGFVVEVSVYNPTIKEINTQIESSLRRIGGKAFELAGRAASVTF